VRWRPRSRARLPLAQSCFPSFEAYCGTPLNWFFFAAAVLAILVGLVHSVLGERLIFRRMRQGGLIPTNGARLIGEGHVRILWATWHVVTIFGWSFAAILFWLGQVAPSVSHSIVVNAIVIAMSASAVLVFVGTRARHPGWVGLLGVAVLTWLGRAAG
jgi:branched-subunit amino acid ABC-type transport system permease component